MIAVNITRFESAGQDDVFWLESFQQAVHYTQAGVSKHIAF